MAAKEYSIIEYYAEHEGYRCGYCKSSDSNYSHGMWAHSLTVEDYQDLIDRGWRRSGRYCYKPTMHVTCCPMYTIKCEALELKITKSQKKVLKRVNRYLAFGDNKANDVQSVGSDSVTSESEACGGLDVVDNPELHPKALKSAEKTLVSEKTISMHPSLLEKVGLGYLDGMISDSLNKISTLAANAISPILETESQSKSDSLNKKCSPGLGPDESRPPSKKAKLLRMERKHQKLVNQGMSKQEVEFLLNKSKNAANNDKSLDELINESLSANPVHKLEVRLVRSHPSSREVEESAEEEFELYRKYQMAVHGDSSDKCTPRQYTRFLVNSPIKTCLVSAGSAQFNRSLAESRALFAKYQITIHREKPDECNAEAFYEFLVVTPLAIEGQHTSGGPPQGYGSFHQQYRLDGRLIAVGVIDILPKCVSSVYFYYDPDFGHLSLGTYASLRELALTRSLHQYAPSLQYYYMGFYIHTCPKMRYKASYRPSYLLCPETYTWNPISPCLEKLETSKYSRLDDDLTATDANSNISIDNVLVLSNQRAMPYHIYKLMERDAKDAEEVVQYATLVGMKCASRILLIR